MTDTTAVDTNVEHFAPILVAISPNKPPTSFSVSQKRDRRRQKKLKGRSADTGVDTAKTHLSVNQHTYNPQNNNQDDSNITTSVLSKSEARTAARAEIPQPESLKPRGNSHLSVIAASLPAPVMNPARLFVVSLGNPPPYSATRHSAGHILIKTLQSHLQFPSFHKSKSYANGLTSAGADVGRPDLTLWQSPSLMNVSGVALLKAYKSFMSSSQLSPTDPLPGLIILYDEMETAPSQLRLRRGATSPKGHNGLKSVQQTLQAAGLMNKLGDRYVKIGIGIGRPPGGSRSSDDVSQYVLGQLTGGEKQALDSKVADLAKLLDAEWARMSS